MTSISRQLGDLSERCQLDGVLLFALALSLAALLLLR
jgi:hypothetical protein